MKRYFIGIILFISQSVGQQYLYENFDSLTDEFSEIMKEINMADRSSKTLQNSYEAIESLGSFLSMLTIHHNYRRIIVSTNCESKALKDGSNIGLNNALRVVELFIGAALVQLDIYEKFADKNIEKKLLKRCINNIKSIRQELEIQIDSL